MIAGFCRNRDLRQLLAAVPKRVLDKVVADLGEEGIDIDIRVLFRQAERDLVKGELGRHFFKDLPEVEPLRGHQVELAIIPGKLQLLRKGAGDRFHSFEITGKSPGISCMRPGEVDEPAESGNLVAEIVPGDAREEEEFSVDRMKRVLDALSLGDIDIIVHRGRCAVPRYRHRFDVVPPRFAGLHEGPERIQPRNLLALHLAVVVRVHESAVLGMDKIQERTRQYLLPGIPAGIQAEPVYEPGPVSLDNRDGQGCILHEKTVPLLALFECRCDLFLRGHIGTDAQHTGIRAAGIEQGLVPPLDPDPFAVLFDILVLVMGKLFRAVHDIFEQQRKVTLRFGLRGRDDGTDHGAAEDLCVGVPEKLLGVLVKKRDIPVPVAFQDDVVCVLHEFAVLLLAGADRFPRLFALNGFFDLVRELGILRL